MFSHLLGARSTFAIVAFIVGFNANATMIPDYHTAVRAQIDSEDCDGVDCVDVISVVYGDTFAETGTAPLAYAKARAGYGDQGGYAIATDQPDYIGAYAESIWVDAFTITGGTGTGNLAISVLVNGTQEGDGANSLFHL